jgi:hypothetical protein
MIAFWKLTIYRFPVVWSGVIFLSYYTCHAQLFEESIKLLFIENGAAIAAILFDLDVGRKKLLKYKSW